MIGVDGCATVAFGTNNELAPGAALAALNIHHRTVALWA
jgi:hypothetical protein